MSTCFDFLDYPTLLALDGADSGRSALIQALSAVLCMDVGAYIDQHALVLQTPAASNPDDPTETSVTLHDPAGILTDATLIYRRLDLGDYLKDCGLAIPAPDYVPPSIPGPVWLVQAQAQLKALHGIDLAQTDLATSTPDPSANPNVAPVPLTLTVNPLHYVWTGSVTLQCCASTLFNYAFTDLTLVAKPGTATGIRRADVGLTDLSSSDPTL